MITFLSLVATSKLCIEDRAWQRIKPANPHLYKWVHPTTANAVFIYPIFSIPNQMFWKVSQRKIHSYIITNMPEWSRDHESRLSYNRTYQYTRTLSDVWWYAQIERSRITSPDWTFNSTSVRRCWYRNMRAFESDLCGRGMSSSSI